MKAAEDVEGEERRAIAAKTDAARAAQSLTLALSHSRGRGDLAELRVWRQSWSETVAGAVSALSAFAAAGSSRSVIAKNAAAMSDASSRASALSR